MQPLSPEALTQRTAEATLHKLEAEAKLVDVQLQQAQRYWFVPVFRAIGAGMILTFALFVLYQPVVDRAEKVAEREVIIAS